MKATAFSTRTNSTIPFHDYCFWWICGEREFLKLRSLFHNRFKALLSSRHPFGLLAPCGKIIQKVSILKNQLHYRKIGEKSEKIEK